MTDLEKARKILEMKTFVLIEAQEEMTKQSKKLNMATGEHNIALRLYSEELKKCNKGGK